MSELKKGNVAVVTGATGGLGSALVLALRERGLDVVETDVVSREGVQYLDVTDFEACRKLAKDVNPDIWVNNAGILSPGAFNELDYELIKKTVEINLMGVINGTLAAVEIMQTKNRGQILNIGSLSSFAPTPGLAIYAATKHAVRAYSHSVAAELAHTNIKISVICPDGIWTPMLKEAVHNKAASMAFSRGKLLEPKAVAEKAIEILEREMLVGSIPKWRSFISRLGGEYPGLLVKAYKMSSRQGRAAQKRYESKL
jgi:short-subunit dehydrogenase